MQNHILNLMTASLVVDVDQAFEYSPKKSCKKLIYQFKNASHHYEVNDLNHLEMDSILFPGIRSCHVIIAENLEKNIFWFAHISKAQQYSDFVENDLIQPAPAYQQLLAENYRNQNGIKATQKTNFTIVDPSATFDLDLFKRVLGERIHSCTVMNPKVSHQEAGLFIFYQVSERTILLR